MHRKILIIAAITVLSITAPLSAAPPFGSLGGPVGGGNAGAGVIPLHGWALDDDGVAWVDILVDGRWAGRAQYGRSRPGVAENNPGYPDSAAAGFAFELDSTRYLNGLHRVTARVVSETGEAANLTPVVLEFTNLTHNLAPFGVIDFPDADAELFGTCDLADPNRRYSVVTGYALDVGVEVGDQGVGYVELLIDGAIFADSLVSCEYDEDRGGMSNCYGLRRLDVTRIYPYLSDSPHSGFRFVLDVGALINFGYTPGRHVLTIRSGDISGQVANIDEIPVTFSCDEFLGNEGSFGKIDRPRDALIYQGTLEAVGWALDWEGVSRVLVFIDGHLAGQATYGLVRPGVTSKYPGYPDSSAPGWVLSVDTTGLSNGQHLFQVLVRDDTGEETLIGERRFVVLNP